MKTFFLLNADCKCLLPNANLHGTYTNVLNIMFNIANCIYTISAYIEKIFIKCDLQYVVDANCFIKEMGNGMRKELVFCT